ncbi:MAG: hypothetical protein RLZZ444_3513, partial [Pseudomonadota bacterium]
MPTEYSDLTDEGQIPHPQYGDSNGFRANARAMLKHGYCPLPVGPGAKWPSEYFGLAQDEQEAGRYRVSVGELCAKPLVEWSKYSRERWLSHDLDGLAYDLEAHERAPALGIGILCDNVVGIDIDSDDPEAIEAVRLVVADACADGAAYVAKRGKKGLTVFGRNDGLAYTKLAFAGRLDFIEILARGKMSVLPPSVHPDLKRPYVWVSERTLFDTPIEDLPSFNGETIRQIKESLAA